MRQIDLSEYKSIIVEILRKIDRICRNNGLKYSLAYGTLIGAVRHDGFIPWDDDADIVLIREDYIRLREIINQGDFGIRFIDTTTDYNTIYPFGKICDVRTHLKEKNFRQISNYGAFVDVFPLDYLPNDEKQRKAFCSRYRRQMIMITHSTRTGYEKTDSIIKNLKRGFAFQMGKLFDASKMIRKMDMEFVRRDTNPTDYVGIPWAWGGLFYPKIYFTDLVEHVFEGYSFLIPREYDAVLKSRYGDYMKLPPEKERVSLHQLECFIDD